MRISERRDGDYNFKAVPNLENYQLLGSDQGMVGRTLGNDTIKSTIAVAVLVNRLGGVLSGLRRGNGVQTRIHFSGSESALGCECKN